MTPALQGYYVYRLYDGSGRLLYVGCSRNLRQRARQHACERFWWPLVASQRLVGPFTDRTSARDYEKATIRAEAPRHNQMANPHERGPLTPEERAALDADAARARRPRRRAVPA